MNRGGVLVRSSARQPAGRSALVRFLGLDPGLRSIGYAVAEVDIRRRQIARVVDVGVIETARDLQKVVRKTSDDLRRSKIQASILQTIARQSGASVLAMETSSTTPYTYPTFSFGVMTGIAASLGLPIIEILPHEVKEAATGDRRATKREVIAWALRTAGNTNLAWPTSNRSNSYKLLWRGRHVKKSAEHPADALAAIQAALRSNQFALAVGLFAE